jgi:hypothetical protein
MDPRARAPIAGCIFHRPLRRRPTLITEGSAAQQRVALAVGVEDESPEIGVASCGLAGLAEDVLVEGGAGDELAEGLASEFGVTGSAREPDDPIS